MAHLRFEYQNGMNRLVVHETDKLGTVLFQATHAVTSVVVRVDRADLARLHDAIGKVLEDTAAAAVVRRALNDPNLGDQARTTLTRRVLSALQDAGHLPC